MPLPLAAKKRPVDKTILTLIILDVVAVVAVLVYFYGPPWGFDIEQSQMRYEATVKQLAQIHQDNLAQGPDAEWFNLYAYILYHVPYKAIGEGVVTDALPLPKRHPCGCRAYKHGWVLLKNGVLITGLTQFWDAPQVDLQVPLCIDTNAEAQPNKLGEDVFTGRLVNDRPNGKARFEWPFGLGGCAIGR